jgi:hypothetical protein
MFIPSGVAAASGKPLKITADKTSVNSNGQDLAPCGPPGTSDLVTCTAEGGTPPYTFAWSNRSTATSGPYSPTQPTSNITAFTVAQVCDADSIQSEIWRCTVTDALLRTSAVDVTVNLTWTDLS